MGAQRTFRNRRGSLRRLNVSTTWCDTVVFPARAGLWVLVQVLRSLVMTRTHLSTSPQCSSIPPKTYKMVWNCDQKTIIYPEGKKQTICKELKNYKIGIKMSRKHVTFE